MKVEYVFTILTIINALFVTFVIFMQYKLSKDKFKLDLFDKRYAVYKGTQKFLSKILKDAKIEIEDIFEFRGDTQDAVFLFEEDIPVYLKTIDGKALGLWEKRKSLEGIPKGEKRSEICREETNLLHWLTSQLPELKSKFKPYLAFRKWK